MPRNKNQSERSSRESESQKDPVRNKTSDLSDSPRDEERLKNEESTIELPEVKDIPGQEHIRVPYMREMVDTTISSTDEEGKGIVDELNQGEEGELIKMGTESDITPAEIEMLKTAASYYPSKDEDQLVGASMDNVDFDGEPLNEKGFGVNMRTSKDLDVPGAEDDDELEDIGEEDEENNEYSLGSDDKSQLEERNS